MAAGATPSPSAPRAPRDWSRAGLAAALVAVGVAQAMAPGINPYHLDVAIGCGIAIILAVSLNLVNGHTGQFSLGHAGFMAVGAYASAAISWFGGGRIFETIPETGWQAHALFLVALLGGGLAAAIAGVLVGTPSLRLRGDYLALVTLGFGEIIRVLFRNLEPMGGSLGFHGVPALTNLAWVYGVAAVTVYVVTSMVRSSWGRGFIATHDDEIASEAMGLNTTRYKVLAFTVGAFFAGVAGALFAHFKLSIEPSGFGFARSIEIVVMVIVGGMGRTAGVVLAAVVLTVLPEVLRDIAEYRMVLYSILLITLMIVRPQGLLSFGRRRG
jgi:branched-chain amino acid transport system permease protein